MTQIPGPDGRPINTSDLKREIAAPTLQGVRTAWTETMVSGMTPSRLAAVLRGAAANEITEFLTLAEQMEEIDPHYGAVLGTRKLAVSSLQPHISVHDDKDARAVEIADACRTLVRAPGFRVALSGLLDALGKGFAVVEIHWDYSSSRWTPAAFEWRDPRFFQFDKRTGRQVRLREDGNTEGVELPAAKFMIHFPNLKCGLPIRGGLARLAAWTWLYKNYTIKDWMTFLEVYGMPIRLGRFGPSATEDDRRKLLKAVANIGTDAAAIVPQGMDIEFVESKGGGTGGSAVFSGMADYLDKQVSKGVLGQTMTTDDGASLAQAEVHEKVRGDIRESDAGWLEATINRDLIRPFIDLNFGVQEHYPWFTLPIPEAEELKAFTDNVTAFMDRGLEVSAAQIREKFGLDRPTDAEDILVGRPGPATLADAPTD